MQKHSLSLDKASCVVESLSRRGRTEAKLRLTFKPCLQLNVFVCLARDTVVIAQYCNCHTSPHSINRDVRVGELPSACTLKQPMDAPYGGTMQHQIFEQYCLLRPRRRRSPQKSTPAMHAFPTVGHELRASE